MNNVEIFSFCLHINTVDVFRSIQNDILPNRKILIKTYRFRPGNRISFRQFRQIGLVLIATKIFFLERRFLKILLLHRKLEVFAAFSGKTEAPKNKIKSFIQIYLNYFFLLEKTSHTRIQSFSSRILDVILIIIITAIVFIP